MTVVYEVCNTGTTPAVCDTATVTIDVGCNQNNSNSDCDGDGNPNGTDPHPSIPTAVDDVFAPMNYTDTQTYNILSNDDFVP